MRIHKPLTTVNVLLSLFVVCVAHSFADVTLPWHVFDNHMVLQRDMPLPVWGWAEPGEEVTVKLDDKTNAKATANQQGNWKVTLPAIKADGQSHRLTVVGINRIEIEDVLIGDVWIGSGQSNMEWTVNQSDNAQQEMAAATYPEIRCVMIPQAMSEQPQATCDARWTVCTPESVGGFSGVAYYFARRLHRELGVPVGIICSSWGGTPIEAWTSREAQVNVKQLEEALKVHDDHRHSWHRTGVLYNAMVAPLIPYAITGVIWYQGEANAFDWSGGAENPRPCGRAHLFGQQLKVLADDWRGKWGQGDFPFIWAQLANFYQHTPDSTPEQIKTFGQKEPSEQDGWVIVQEQMVKALEHKNTGIAIINDIGLPHDVHPTNKQAVGYRMAQWALARHYGKPIVPCGPLYRGMHLQGDQIVIEFDYTGSGLQAKGGQLNGFAIAGADREFVWADAKLAGDQVVVWSDQIKQPAAVRYAWARYPVPVTLYNKEGLPASAFRTDDW